MKQSILILSFLLPVLAKAQQNLFNIPSGEITPKNKVFFQQQININSTTRYSSKSHFVYGLGKNWEAGVNLVNAYFDLNKKPALLVSTPFNSKEPYPLYPVLLLTSQKRWNINSRWHINAGTQAGTNVYKTLNAKRFTHFSYAMAGYQSRNHKLKILAGPYITDSRFVGGGNNAGIQAGVEYHINKKWLFMADHISGTHKNGVSVTGLTYNVSKGFQLCGGWLIPNPGSKEQQAFVLEINLFNF
jgi:hypothetical protein